MAKVDLKKSVHDYVDNADERLLMLIKELVETYKKGEAGHNFPKEQQKVLDQRLADHLSEPNTGKEWSGLRSELRSKYGL